jgi:hypothetical protein
VCVCVFEHCSFSLSLSSSSTESLSLFSTLTYSNSNSKTTTPGTEATEQREKHKMKYERVKRILLETQGGVEHLYSKIKHVDVSGLQKEEDETKTSTVNMLYNCETILSELQRRVETRRGESGVIELDNMRNEIRDDDIMASRPYNRRVEADGMSSPLHVKSNDMLSSTDLNTTDCVTSLQDEVDENVTREQMKMAAKQRVKQNLDAKRIIEEAKVEVDEDSMRRANITNRGTSGTSNVSSSTSSTRAQTGSGLRPQAV